MTEQQKKHWYLLAKKELHPTNNGEMNYCPYCLKQMKKEIAGTSKTIRDVLNPVTYHKFLHITHDSKGEEIKTIEEVWKCGKCDKNLTPDDWIEVYSEKKSERIDAI